MANKKNKQGNGNGNGKANVPTIKDITATLNKVGGVANYNSAFKDAKNKGDFLGKLDADQKEVVNLFERDKCNTSDKSNSNDISNLKQAFEKVKNVFKNLYSNIDNNELKSLVNKLKSRTDLNKWINYSDSPNNNNNNNNNNPGGANKSDEDKEREQLINYRKLEQERVVMGIKNAYEREAALKALSASNPPPPPTPVVYDTIKTTMQNYKPAGAPIIPFDITRFTLAVITFIVCALLILLCGTLFMDRYPYLFENSNRYISMTLLSASKAVYPVNVYKTAVTSSVVLPSTQTMSISFWVVTDTDTTKHPLLLMKGGSLSTRKNPIELKSGGSFSYTDIASQKILTNESPMSETLLSGLSYFFTLTDDRLMAYLIPSTKTNRVSDTSDKDSTVVIESPLVLVSDRLNSGTKLSRKTWHHIALIATEVDISLIIDGKLVDSKPTDYTMDSARVQYNEVGNTVTSTDPEELRTTTFVRDVSITQHALPMTAVALIFKEGKGGLLPSF